jgi:hypothetical protein
VIDHEQVKAEIDRILSSESLAGKNQLKRLLEFLFRNMDSQAALKPSHIIRELWPEESSTKGSTDVATEMNRLRRAVESYYSIEGENDAVAISFPSRAKPGSDGEKDRRWIVAIPRQGVEIALAPNLQSISTPAWIPASPPVRPSGRRARFALAGTLVVVALVAGFAAKFLRADNVPQAGILSGETLTIVNSEGQELWHKSFAGGFWPEYYGQGLAQRLWIGDLAGDGHSEVLFLYNPAGNPKSHSTTLICFSDRGEEKWRWTPGRALPELNGTPPVYLTFGFGVLKSVHGAPRRIVLSSQNEPYYPDQIAVIDSNGKTISEYWHSGILNHLALADLDGSGREEILASGISNGYDQATLVVLDPDRVFGASVEAARPEVQLHGMGFAQERVRLLFPRSDLNKSLSVYNAGQDMTIANGRVRLIVWECSLTPTCLILYEFDKDFNLRAVTPDDQFVSAHKQFFLNRKDNHPFTAEEAAEFRKVRCLVGCKTPYVPVKIP